MQGESKALPARPECLRCKHYFVTWSPRFPYGCRAFGFKSKVIPCLEVYTASHQQCMKFEARPALDAPTGKRPGRSGYMA